MAILVIAGLLLIIIILVVICIHRKSQVTSLKRQVEFLEYSLEQLTENEELKPGIRGKKRDDKL